MVISGKELTGGHHGMELIRIQCTQNRNPRRSVEAGHTLGSARSFALGARETQIRR
jgi:hypothetical protein